ncbi:hypothetical protein HDU78_002108 [Chytriomyces hyalinus]|nr:hypothetical protein HDU78_002108 [Chytriomyces hyalinus]
MTEGSNTAAKRLLKEINEIHKAAARPGGVDSGVLHLSPIAEDSLFSWVAVITSSETNGDSPYKGGRFKVAIEIPEDYPVRPPTMKFISKVCHPNVHWKTGEICLDLLKSAWSPAWTLKTACVAISLLLDAPEPDSPLNCDAANLLRCNDRRGYDSLIKMYTSLYSETD